jgi:hypothetical protein
MGKTMGGITHKYMDLIALLWNLLSDVICICTFKSCARGAVRNS